jgi:hypothetical protein
MGIIWLIITKTEEFSFVIVCCLQEQVVGSAAE